jgi:hypothetical protein
MAMFKTHYWDDQEQLLQDCDGVMASLIDTEFGVKSANSALVSRDMLEAHRPDKDHFLIHLIGMGDTETYGWNRNMDGWSKRALTERHPTFVSHGRYYEEHANKDPNKNLGMVKFAGYDGEPGGMRRVELLVWGHKKKAAAHYEAARRGEMLKFSMSAKVKFDVCNCLPAGTTITTVDGLVPVEDIKVGMLVLTQDGTWKPVTQLFHREGVIPLVSLDVQGVPDPLQLTEDHEVLILDSAHTTENQHKYQRPVRDDAGNIVGMEGFGAPTYVPAKYVKNRDVVLYPVRPDVDTLVAPEVDPWICGLYLADGCMCGCGRGRKHDGEWVPRNVMFSIADSQPDILDELQDRHDGYIAVRPEQDGKKACKATISDSTFAGYLYQQMGRAKGKCVPKDVLSWSREDRLKFLAGWFDGDGHYNKRAGRLRGVSVLRELVFGIRDVAASLGIPVSIHKVSVTSEWGVSPFAYFVAIHKKYAAQVLQHTVRWSDVEAPDNGTTSERSFMLHVGGLTYLAHRVSGVGVGAAEEVFNFEVDTNHNYVANGIITHNCCGNVARRRSEYCDCMKKRAGQYIEEFKKYAYVDNPEPVFVDISKVRTNADRIAEYLEYMFHNDEESFNKAASAEHVQPILGTDWAQFEGIWVPDDVVEDELRKIAQVEEQVHDVMLRGASTTDEQAAFYKAASGAVFGEDLTDEQLAVAAGMRPGELMYKLAQRQAVLPFRSFYAYAQGKTNAEVDADPVFHKSAGLLSEIFRTAADMGGFGPADLGPMLAADSPSKISLLSPACDASGDSINKLMEHADQAFGLGDERPRSRMMITIVMKKASAVDSMECDTSQLKEAKQIALAYGSYQVQALRDIEDLNKSSNIEQMRELLTLSNRFTVDSK